MVTSKDFSAEASRSFKKRCQDCFINKALVYELKYLAYQEKCSKMLLE